MKRLISQSILFFLLLFISTNSSFAQGKVTGTVIEESTGEALFATNIVLKSDPSKGTDTDFDGKYTLELEAGTYTLICSYIGYPNLEITDVVVKDGETTFQDFIFKEGGGIEIETVKVVAKASNDGEGALLVSVLKSDRFTDAIGSKEMAKLNISSADQAVAKQVGITVADGSVVVRGLGDRYSTAQLNGAQIPSANPYKNSVNLDLIPSNLLANVITSKTFTPDQPGTFTGGNVNLKTKSFPEERSLQFSVSTGYNTQSSLTDDFLTHDGGQTDWLGYDDGYRALDSRFTDENYQAALLRSALQKGRTDDQIAAQMEELSNEINPNMNHSTKKSSINQGFGISYGNNFNVGGRDLGVIFSANYSRKFQHYNGTLNNFTFEGGANETLNPNFLMNGTTSVESPTVGGMLGLAYKIDNFNTISFNTLYNHSADKSTRFYAGEYATYQVLDDEEFQFRELYWLERSLINSMLIGEHAFKSNNDIRLNWVLSASQASQDEPELRYLGNEFDPRDLDDPTDDRWAIRAPSEYDWPNHFFRYLEDKQYEGKFDLTLPILKNWTKGNKLKFGGLYSTKQRDFSERRYSIQKGVNTTQFDGDIDSYFGAENTGTSVVDGSLNEVKNSVIDDSKPSNFYTGEENIAAAFAMVTLNPTDRFKVVAGARFENAELPITSQDSTTVAKKASFLPSINLIYNLKNETGNKMNLRAAYSNTVARPNLRELAPFSNFDFRTGAFVTGNPDLNITSITNADLKWEWLRKNDMLAASVYYKSFVDPIVLVNLGKSNPEFQFQNVDQATVYGAEIEFKKSLGFISPKLNNLRWSTNFAYIYSQVDIDPEELSNIQQVNPNASGTRTFFNQSPFVVNTNLTYSHPESKIDAALVFSMFGDRLVIVGGEGTPDIFEQSRPQLDFNISKKFNDVLNVRLSAQNLLDPNYTLQSSFLDNDYIYSNYRLGRTFTMSLSYTIK